MKILITILIFFLTKLSIGQNIKITIKSENKNELLKGVLIYSNGKLVGETNNDGVVILETKLLNNIQIVKEDFYDLSLKKSELSQVIYLKKNEIIELKEVVVVNYDNNQILDKIEYNLTTNKTIYKNLTSMQYFNSLVIDNDTLHYLNNRLVYKINDGFYINNQIRIVKKFYLSDGFLVYALNNKKLGLWVSLNSRLTSIGHKDDFPKILKNRSDYIFEINKDDDYYKINFKSKKNKKFTYEGYLIVDKIDFGIYELEMNLIPNSDNIYSTYLFKEKQNQSYIINEEYLFYSMTKINNEYYMNSSKYDYIFTQTKGDFKGLKLINKFRIEDTPDFTDTNMYKFDFVNYEKL